MNDKLHEVIEKKIDAVLTKTDEIKKIISSLNEISTNSDDFSVGIIIGRLYNSFYYQSRRILQRDPTEDGRRRNGPGLPAQSGMRRWQRRNDLLFLGQTGRT